MKVREKSYLSNLYIVIFSVLFGAVNAQDPIFSQYFASPIHLNPAFTGLSEAPRFGLNYRNQLPLFGSYRTYVTYSATYDQYFESLKSGFGIQLLSDEAGEGILKNNKVALLYGYRIPMLRKGHYLKGGLEFGIVNFRYDWDQFVFGDQIQDLENTVEQLRAAMKSIDQETRKLFMSTFDRVNTELQDLFPKVFNGGEASLSLEDDWQSGVKLMARPPGKRNSSLALLSGGEKALTALALVFAIFRLNPSPFCVLDEVDAPLDDANVGRFCNLVKELSEQVQFIYITHNKLAMTMATDLLGVTMPEPGTSKLVTVNLEQAKEYGLVAEA